MWVTVLVFVEVLCFSSQGFLVASEPINSRKCDMEHDDQLLGSYCNDLFLASVPGDIDTHIMIFDLSYNIIQKLKNSSFIKYPLLQYLYLEENYITFIDIGAFNPIPDLKVLDLSSNRLHLIPKAINSLPVLQKLYLDDNNFETVLFTDPLPSISFIGLSGCRLKDFPILKSLPKLQHVNLSNNFIEAVSIRDLAPLCQLKNLYLSGNAYLFPQFDAACDCLLLTMWSGIREFKITPNNDTICQSAFEGLKQPFDNSTCNGTKLVLQESESVIKQCPDQVPRPQKCVICQRAAHWALGILGTSLIVYSGQRAWRRSN